MNHEVESVCSWYDPGHLPPDPQPWKKTHFSQISPQNIAESMFFNVWCLSVDDLRFPITDTFTVHQSVGGRLIV